MDQAKILVIDDEVGICDGIKRGLTPLGYRVDTCLNGEEGLRSVRANGYDLILIDVMMPGVSGIDLIGAIHAHDPETICIMITGYATVELAVNAIKAGAYDFLAKPFTIDALLHAVNQGLEHRQLVGESKRVQAAEAEARRLEELDRAKRAFLRLVTHELKRPVGAIQNYLTLIRDGYIAAEQLPEIIQKCLERGNQEMALIADLLELSRLQSLETLAEPQPVALDEILQTVVASFDEQIGQKRQHLHLEIGANLPRLAGFPDRFNSLWTNLIGNAIKYTPEGGNIYASLYFEYGKLIGQVSDTGIGIPSGDLSRLFTEFFRAANARALEIPGTGLGLAIVKQIVDGAGGEIKVSSEPGQGTTFTFWLPVERG